MVKLQILINGRRKELVADVVNNNIQLLSKPSMGELGMVIDFSKNLLKIDGEVLKLDCNSAGHYIIPVSE